MIESDLTSNESQWQPREFRTTHWSVVLAAGEGDSPAAAAALGKLCCQYWYPLYTFVRRSGHAPADAEDLTQSFFARLLEKRYLGLADREKGRFRTFLLCSLKRFLADEWDKMKAQKRGGGLKPISLNEETSEGRYRLEPADTLDPEALYERRWAHSVLDESLARLSAEFEADGKAAQFGRLEVFIVGDKGDLPMAQAAADLGMSEPALKSLVHRMRRRYCELVREVVAETVQDPREVEAEIRHLLGVLSP